MVEQSVAHLDNVRVEGFDSLIIEHARDLGASVLVKGWGLISGLRLRVPDGSAQQAFGSRDRNRLSAGLFAVQLHQLEQGPGWRHGGRSRRLGPRPRRAGAAGAAWPGSWLGPLGGCVGRTGAHRQAGRPDPQRAGGAPDRPGADRPRGHLRAARPDAVDQSRRRSSRRAGSSRSAEMLAGSSARPSGSSPTPATRRPRRPPSRRSSSAPSARRRRSSRRRASASARCGSARRTTQTRCSGRSRSTSASSCRRCSAVGSGSGAVRGPGARARRPSRRSRLSSPVAAVEIIDLRALDLAPGSETRLRVRVPAVELRLGGQDYQVEPPEARGRAARRAPCRACT